MREVAVGMLSRRDRATKHLAVARYAESLIDDELAGMIASQYLEAVRATPAEEVDPAITLLAVEWLRRAASRARSLGSPREAITLHEEALTLTDDTSTRADLLSEIGEAALMLAEPERARAVLSEARLLRDELGDVEGAGEIVARLGRIRSKEHSELARQECEAYFERIGEDGNAEVRANLANSIASSLFETREFESATRWSEFALGLAELVDDDALFAGVLGIRSFGLYVMGRHREAVLLAEGMRGIADRSGALREMVIARMGVALYVLPDDPAAMLATSWDAVELSRRGGSIVSEATNLLNIAETCLAMGRYREAREAVAVVPEEENQVRRDWRRLIEIGLAAMADDPEGLVDARALSEDVSDSDPASTTTVLGLKAFVELAVGDLDVAQRLADLAVEIDPTGINASSCLLTAGHAAIWRRDLDAARRVHQGMLRIRGRLMAAGRTTISAGIAALEGSIDEAAALYRHAIERWREIDMPSELALCEMEVVISLGKDHPDATVAKEALDVFDEIGALAYRRRLDAALGVA